MQIELTDDTVASIIVKELQTYYIGLQSDITDIINSSKTELLKPYQQEDLQNLLRDSNHIIGVLRQYMTYIEFNKWFSISK